MTSDLTQGHGGRIAHDNRPPTTRERDLRLFRNPYTLRRTEDQGLV